MGRKDFRKGFLNNGIPKPKTNPPPPPPAPPAGASPAFIAELKRTLRIRNECMKIRSRTLVNTQNGFISEIEREACFAFHELMDNAPPHALADHNVCIVSEQFDNELQEILELNDWFPVGKPSSSASEYQARKRKFISELKRLLSIRNEYTKIKNSSKKKVCEHGFIDEREREAFTAFKALIAKAEPGLMSDPDVVEIMEQSDHELAEEVFGVPDEDFSTRVYNAKEGFIKGLKVGEEVRIVGGRDVGKKGKILEVRAEDDLVVLRFLNGEETVVWVGNVANLGSAAEDMCLAKLMDPKGKGKETEDTRMEELVKNLKILGKGQFSRSKYY